MLSLLRESTKGWTARILLLLLVASFAVWGVSGSILQGVGNSVVTVGETSVTPLEYRLAYDRQLNQLQRQLGNRITREQADAFGLSSGVLTNLVSGALLDETAREMSLGMSDDRLAAAIGDDPAFKDATGRFSRVQLQQVLNSIGMPEANYVETRRAVALRNQMIESTTGKSSMPDAYWKILGDYQNEQRKFNFVTIGMDDIKEIEAPSDEVMKEFYEANKSEYVAPEFRKLNVVKLEAEDIADPASVSAEDVMAAYEARKDSFSEPEQRTIEQLVFTDNEKAKTALEQLKSGKSFEAVVQAEGKSLDDINLGTLKKSDIPDTAIAEAAFVLDIDTPSELIEGVFGRVILRVTRINPGSTKTLGEVEDELRKSLALERATDDLFDTHDKLEDERAAGETLVDAAKAVDLPTRVIEAVDRSSRDMEGNIINDLPQSRELLSEAFQTDEGVETSPINMGTEGFVWFEVVKITPERQKPFDEVRDEVQADWMADARNKALDELAEAVRAKVADGTEFNQVISELLPANSGGENAENTPSRIVQLSIPLKRNGNTPELPQSTVSAGFEIPKGASAIANANDAEKRLVLQVAEIIKSEGAPLAGQEKTTINTVLADDIVSQMVTRIQENKDVEINQQAINAALAY